MGQVTFNIIESGGKVQAVLPHEASLGVLANSIPQSALDPAEVGNPRPAISTYPDDADTGFGHAPWGPTDDFPNRVHLKNSRVAIAQQAILKLAKKLYGAGIYYVRRSDFAKTRTPDRAYIPDVEDFLDDNEINLHWYFPQCLEWQTLWNTFSEMKLSLSKKYVVGIYHKEANFCRLSVQDKNTGVIRNLIYDTRFAFWQHQNLPGDPSNPKSDTPKSTVIPLIPWWRKEEWLSNLGGYTFAWHTRIRSGAAIYYPMPPWEGLFKKNGWMDSAADVPRIVNSMQQNQIRLKYQFVVEETYFKILHPEWESYTAEQRRAAIDKLNNTMNETLVGVDSGYTSLLSVFKYDATLNQMLGKVEIVAVDDKIKADAWVPGSEKANFEIVQGLGAHPTDFGLARENGSMGAGSGSAEMQNYNISTLTNTIEQEYLLAPLNFIARYNRWDVRFMIDNPKLTTQNGDKSGVVGGMRDEG